MKRKNFIKITLTYLTIISMLFPTITPVFAVDVPNETPLLTQESSVGSATTDISSETKVGLDKVQEQKTEYSEELTEEYLESTQNTKVYVTQASSFSIIIPKVIILGGETKDAHYQVGVKGDLSGKGYINVLAQPSFWMYDISGIKKAQKAYVAQDNNMFVSSTLDTVPEKAINGVNDNEYVYTQGYIHCDGITAGNWASSFNFVIAGFADFENPVPIATDGTILKVASENMYIGVDYNGTKNAQVTINGIAVAQEEELNKDLVPQSLDNSDGNDDITIKETNEEPLENSKAKKSLFDVLTLTENVYADDALSHALETAQSLEWYSNSEKIKVSQDGRVSLADDALVGDTATITATYKGVEGTEPGTNDREDVSISFVVTVFDIEFDKKEVSLECGQNDIVNAKIIPETISLDMQFQDPSMLDGVTFNKQKIDTGKYEIGINVANDAMDDNADRFLAEVEDYTKAIRVEVLAKHEHTYELTETVAATCTEMGHKTYTCKTCDETEEGHSYIVYEPKLGHTPSTADSHWCARCDTMINPYKIGEKITRKVAGQSIQFICVDDDYEDVSGKKGAYFLAINLIKGMKYNTVNNATWANSTMRQNINGDNSDKTHIMLTDTTVKETALKEIGSPFFGLSDFTFTAYNGKQTNDYYFVPSIREIANYYQYAFWADGNIPPSGDGKNTFSADGSFVYYFRTPETSHPSTWIYYAYTDGEMITNWDVTGWAASLANCRPACVIEQDVSSETQEDESWVEGDVTYRRVAGKDIKFVCVDPNYIDASGEEVGALFLSSEVIGGDSCIYSQDSNVWETSNTRAFLNGENSDTNGLVLSNTTVLEKANNIVMDRYGVQAYKVGMEDISSNETHDYYFELSLRELIRYHKYMMSSDGQVRDLTKNATEHSFGYSLRTPYGSTTDETYSVYTDTKYYNTISSKVHLDIVGSRPACVLPQPEKKN